MAKQNNFQTFMSSCSQVRSSKKTSVLLTDWLTWVCWEAISSHTLENHHVWIFCIEKGGKKGGKYKATHELLTPSDITGCQVTDADNCLRLGQSLSLSPAKTLILYFQLSPSTARAIVSAPLCCVSSVLFLTFIMGWNDQWMGGNLTKVRKKLGSLMSSLMTQTGATDIRG